MAFGIYQFYSLFQPGFRRRRFKLFVEFFRPNQATRILDVGGFASDWDEVPVESQITVLNLYHPRASGGSSARFTRDIGDARNMPYPDRSFDIVYSNSVIEHLGTFEAQMRFANEIRRVGRQMFVQTPNRYFFIESHFITPFVHFLPWRIAGRLLRFLSFRGLFRGGDNIELKKLAAELRLLNFREMKKLFPDCEIHREKWLGMTKSFIAIRRAP